MSHVARVELSIRSLKDLQAACKELGLELDLESKNWRWFGRWMNDYSAQEAAYHHGIEPSRYGKADVGVIRVPGASYDIGVYKSPNNEGEYVLVYDAWEKGKGIESKVGKGLSRLRQEYAVQVAARQARAKGYKVHRTTQKGGKVRLLCRR